MDYKPKSVLLTGGAGFIGSNVLCFLVKKYPTVSFVCLDRLSYCSSLNNIKDIQHNDNFTFVQGNINSKDILNKIFLTYKIDTIMHFAAETHVDNSFGSSMKFTENNIMGTHMLLEMSRTFSSQIKRFIHVSTDEVYGESTMEDVAKNVNSALNPTNPYAATKAGAEFLVRSYHHSFKLPTIITRGNNVYGPRQYPEKLIPKFILLLDQDKPCPVYGTGQNMRSYLYIDDVCNAFDVVLHKGKVGKIYNIGTSFEITNIQVLKELLKIFGKEKESQKYIQYVEDRAFNDFRYNISSTSLEEFGWTRKVDFPEGLRKTKEWYLENRNWWGNVTDVLIAHPKRGIKGTSVTAQDEKSKKKAKIKST